MESSPKTFLFVNKTQSSRVLSRSEGAERIHVQSHSQRARRLRENKTATIFHESWSVTKPAENRLDLRQRKPRSSKASSSTSRSVSTTSTRSGLIVADSTSEDNKNSENLRLNQCPSGNFSDPFNSTVAGNDILHYHHAILGFVYENSPKIAFFAEAFSPPMQVLDPSPMRHDAAIANRLKYCIQDRALMYSTLAYAMNLLGWREAAAESFKSGEYFTAQAIQAVRERLSSPPNSLAMPYRKADSQLAMSIYSLAVSELWKVMPLMRHRKTDHVAPFETTTTYQKAPTTRVHFYALLELVNSSGGWRAYDPYVFESAVLVDKYLACWESTTPVIAMSNLSLEDDFEIPAIEQQSVSLGAKLLRADLDPKVKFVIEKMVCYIYYARQSWALAPLPFDVQSRLFFHLQLLVYELLNLVEIGRVDNCVRITALIFLHANIHYRGSQLCAVRLVTELRSALVAARFWEQSFGTGLRFWCLSSALLLTERSPDDEWFHSMLEKYSDSIVNNPSPLEEAHACLEQYLYLHDRQAAQLAFLIEGLNSTP